MHTVTIRPRRLRRHPVLRQMVRETSLQRSNLIYPLFIRAGAGAPTPIKAMPGQNQWPLGHLAEEIRSISALGLQSVILFGLPDNDKKDAQGSEAWRSDGIVQKAIGVVKETNPQLQVIGDVCLCQYTDHGHCGPLKGDNVDNDSTLPLLTKIATSYAKAGADMVAPSGMIDGGVAAIRQGLDESGYHDLPIMAYSAKYASSFYGPFREATAGSLKKGDRRTHQMDSGNAREALREMALDVAEGADILMVKPALPYLDIIRMARDNFALPLAAYNVSGEYAMVKAAAQNGWLNGEQVMLEVLTSIRRAGADLILTYFAKEFAQHNFS